jgi:hypothetical protein
MDADKDRIINNLLRIAISAASICIVIICADTAITFVSKWMHGETFLGHRR